MPNMMPQTWNFGFQSYVPNATINPVPYAPVAPVTVVNNAANKVGLAAYGSYNGSAIPIFNGSHESPFLNFLSNTARYVAPYLPKRPEVQKSYTAVGGIRG